MTVKTDHCKEEPGLLIPLISLNSCEGKGPCVDACPYDVLAVGLISDEQYKELSLVGKLKTRVHGKEKAYVLHEDQCHSCGLCVTACPEKAIKLGRK